MFGRIESLEQGNISGDILHLRSCLIQVLPNRFRLNLQRLDFDTGCILRWIGLLFDTVELLGTKGLDKQNFRVDTKLYRAS